jgi:hypothetical protein
VLNELIEGVDNAVGEGAGECDKPEVLDGVSVGVIVVVLVGNLVIEPVTEVVLVFETKDEDDSVCVL